MDRFLTIDTLEEAVAAGYIQGFENGYDAAREIVEMVLDAWRKEPGAYDLDGALKALDMSKQKALEVMGRPDMSVVRVPVSGSNAIN